MFWSHKRRLIFKSPSCLHSITTMVTILSAMWYKTTPECANMGKNKSLLKRLKLQIQTTNQRDTQTAVLNWTSFKIYEYKFSWLPVVKIIAFECHNLLHRNRSQLFHDTLRNWNANTNTEKVCWVSVINNHRIKKVYYQQRQSK